MPFKSLSIVSLILCLAVTTKLSAQSFTQEPFAYRGLLSGLDNVSIRSWAIREDGRYLAYSSGSSSFTLLDLQDGVTKSSAFSTEANVLALFFETKVRLYAVTKNGIKFFDMTKPFAPKEENTDFDIEDSNRGEAIDACVDNNRNVYYLEKDADLDRQVVRVIANRALAGKIGWRTIFPPNPDTHTPVGLRCLESSALVISSRREDDRERVALATVTSSGVAGRIELSSSINYQDYNVVDLHPSADKKSVLVLLENRSATGRNSNDAGVVVLPPNLARSEVINLGSDPKNLAVFLDRGIFMAGFFMGKDILKDPNNPPPDQLLSVIQTGLNSSPNFGDRGLGTPLAGEFGSQSRSTSAWIFNQNDPYAYGIMAANGVSRVSRAPDLELVEGLASSDVSESSTLSFKIRSQVASRYEIYSDGARDQEGSPNGLSDAPGLRVLGGSLDADQVTTIEIPVSDLKISKIGKYSVVIRSQALNLPEKDARFPWARLGIGFQFNPDPLPVTKFSLGFGDESVTVYFRPQDPVANISHYYVYFSTNADDLADLPASEAELASSAFSGLKQTVKKMKGGTFQSPLKLDASTWSGSYRLGPIPNDETVYFRVQVVSPTGKFSSDNDAAIGLSPKSTRSLSQAFGSNASCGISEPESSWEFWALILGFMAILFCIRRWQLAKSLSI